MDDMAYMYLIHTGIVLLQLITLAIAQRLWREVNGQKNGARQIAEAHWRAPDPEELAGMIRELYRSRQPKGQPPAG